MIRDPVQVLPRLRADRDDFHPGQPYLVHDLGYDSDTRSLVRHNDDGTNRRGKPIENDLHYSGEGYKTLGKRFADTALKLIEAND